MFSPRIATALIRPGHQTLPLCVGFSYVCLSVAQLLTSDQTPMRFVELSVGPEVLPEKTTAVPTPVAPHGLP